MTTQKSLISPASTPLTTLPSPPFIDVAGVPNYRDLGGYPTAVSPTLSIRQNLIYRCGEPSKITKEGVEKLKELGVARAYDLRSKPEIENASRAGYGQVTEWEGCERHFVPVFRDDDYSPEGLALRFKNYASEGTEGFSIAYSEILENGTNSYRIILLHLAYEPEKPFIIHCTAGKDRTGVISAVILSLCGVEDEIIAKEYALTELGLPEAWKRAVTAHLMEHPALKGNEDGARNMISARFENMKAFLKLLEKDFGGAECYVIKKCGLTENEVEKIKRNLLVEVPAIHHNINA